MKSMYQIQQGDCLELMRSIPDKSIDMILADLPYGTTACSWDTIIPFEPLWENYKRIIKPNGCIALFGSEPFSSYLRLSNISQYRYDWIWDRVAPSGFLNANLMPMKRHEVISVFVSKGTTTYNKQMEKRNPKSNSLGKIENYSKGKGNSNPKVYGSIKDKKIMSYNEYLRNPTTIIEFSKGNNRHSFHPTQKPVPLLEYLIKTYTNENETVLDNTMGSGSTGVACIRTNRNFIGYEKDSNYYSIAEKRILEEIDKTSLFNSLGGRQDRISA